MLRLLYSALWLLCLPIVLLRLCLKGRQDRRYREHLAERLGRYAKPTFSAPCIWVHAVSVGETRATAPLIIELLKAYPTHNVLLTHMTPTGRQTGQDLFKDQTRVQSVYLPYDLPWFLNGFFHTFRPVLGIVMETELWPNLTACASKLNIPMALVNARLSERSYRRYARWAASLVQQTLARFQLVATQSEEDAKRLQALGAVKPMVAGNLKFDLRPDPAQHALAQLFKTRLADRRLILAASTREGEEALLLSAFCERNWPKDVVLGIVPRHPQRFEAVAQQIQALGLSLQRRSDNNPVQPTTQVWLGDSMGELFAYYGAAQCALIGGSFLPLGGQNLIEAAAMSTPSIVGPSMFNFELATHLAVSCGASIQVKDASDAFEKAHTLLLQTETLAQMQTAAQTFSRAHTGASARLLTALQTILAP